MDRAVLEAYGWQDLAETATCEFLLDYEDDDDEADAPDARPSSRIRKKPWRYRWPDEFRDEVLARLLELNKQRAEQERLAGLAAQEPVENSSKRGGRGRPSRKKTAARRTQRQVTQNRNLFEQ